MCAALLQLAEQTACEQRCGVGAERPRGVGVPDDEDGVGEVLQHHTVPEELVGDAHRLPVDGQRGAARDLQAQPRRGHDHIGVEVLAGADGDA